MWMKSTLTLMVNNHVLRLFQSILVHIRRWWVVIIHKMRKHTHTAWADWEFGVDTFILYKSISLFHSLNRMGRFTILVINKQGRNVLKHGGVEYYSLVTTCWHAPPSFNIFGQHLSDIANWPVANQRCIGPRSRWSSRAPSSYSLP